ncbi:hypothetical protein TVAG_464440 [Trichomonas vaginalis G3]|uniref:Uncharacterized protein n=1 Tax=Trichomonas vaginalis (strain ATCC PRA-98 / G3) TaxID=412133 RepID=A2EEI9_TRIV3|nr:hypothetical protein TVAGG3_1054740 [Trichomonas vaginalis G3]EAY08896.1 hypothetical protein TVAG_464440 [Trichomonas vaginalis G3]KAI5494373.1 hypothetical protein TVAGG3_1054740 [Trichomonas vaginalis G3]|eukprot:XP_001321119.1 hypothetical protein [Trichomonas vaginalis G3]
MRSSNNSKKSTERHRSIIGESRDDSENEQWTPDNEENSKLSNYESDDDLSNEKRRRIRKKGRKAKFLVDQLLYDQQVFANQQQMMQYQAQQVMVPQQIPNITVQYEPVHYSAQFNRNLPDLESVNPNHIPGSFDLVPRGSY